MDESSLQEYIDRGLSIREIANERNVSNSTIQYYLKKFCLKTKRNYSFNDKNSERYIDRICKYHGLTSYILEGRNSYRCRKCRSEAVVRYRQNVKIKLVKLFGGCCIKCGYNRYVGALEFHHRNPEEKLFGISSSLTLRSYDSVLEEAKKCDLLCANCHAEIEGNFGI